MRGEVVRFPPERKVRFPSKGSAGLCCHVPGGMVTVSNVAGVSGGIGPGRLVKTDCK